MKFILKTKHHAAPRALVRLIRTQIEKLGPSLKIDEARVLVARRPEASPRFRVAAHLVTPGPDVFAEGVDHTLAAALKKVVAQLARRIRHRERKRTRRLRNNSGQLFRTSLAGAHY